MNDPKHSIQSRTPASIWMGAALAAAICAIPVRSQAATDGAGWIKALAGEEWREARARLLAMGAAAETPILAVSKELHARDFSHCSTHDLRAARRLLEFAERHPPVGRAAVPQWLLMLQQEPVTPGIAQLLSTLSAYLPVPASIDLAEEHNAEARTLLGSRLAWLADAAAGEELLVPFARANVRAHADWADELERCKAMAITGNVFERELALERWLPTGEPEAVTVALRWLRTPGWGNVTVEWGPAEVRTSVFMPPKLRVRIETHLARTVVHGAGNQSTALARATLVAHGAPAEALTAVTTIGRTAPVPFGDLKRVRSHLHLGLARGIDALERECLVALSVLGISELDQDLRHALATLADGDAPSAVLARHVLERRIVPAPATLRTWCIERGLAIDQAVELAVPLGSSLRVYGYPIDRYFDELPVRRFVLFIEAERGPCWILSPEQETETPSDLADSVLAALDYVGLEVRDRASAAHLLRAFLALDRCMAGRPVHTLVAPWTRWAPELNVTNYRGQARTFGAVVPWMGGDDLGIRLDDQYRVVEILGGHIR